MKQFYRSPFFFILLFLSNMAVNAQQLPIFTQYREMHGYINPASLNMEYILNDDWYRAYFGSSIRSQWIKGPGAPQTQSIHGETLYESRGVSMLSGGYLINDVAGRISLTGAYGRFAGILSDDPYDHGISFGLIGGMVQYRLDLSNVTVRDQGQVENLAGKRKIFPDFGMGVFAYTTTRQSHILYGGLSIPQLFGLDLAYEAGPNTLNVQRVRHYYANAGYLINLNDEFSYFEISGWGRYLKNVPFSWNANIRYMINGVFWMGGGYANSQTLLTECGLVFGDAMGLDWNNRLRLGYGFEAPLGGYSRAFGTTHEINLSFALGNN